MKDSKKLVWKITIILFFFLGTCTIFSYYIKQWLLPTVVQIQGFSVDILPKEGDSKQVSRDNTVIPSGCIRFDSLNNPYIFVLQNRTGIWGLEHYVSKQNVTILEDNEYQVTIANVNADHTFLAAYPSRSLVENEAVRVVDK